MIDFNSSSFSLISEDAKDLLGKLLNRNMYKRISANEALSHPWLSKVKNENPISVKNLEKLENYYVQIYLFSEAITSFLLFSRT